MYSKIFVFCNKLRTLEIWLAETKDEEEEKMLTSRDHYAEAWSGAGVLRQPGQ